MYKAKVSFSGIVSMAAGEVKELTPEIAKDLLKAGYVEEVKKPAPAKAENKKKGAKS